LDQKIRGGGNKDATPDLFGENDSRRSEWKYNLSSQFVKRRKIIFKVVLTAEGRGVKMGSVVRSREPNPNERLKNMKSFAIIESASSGASLRINRSEATLRKAQP